MPNLSFALNSKALAHLLWVPIIIIASSQTVDNRFFQLVPKYLLHKKVIKQWFYIDFMIISLNFCVYSTYHTIFYLTSLAYRACCKNT